MQHSSKFCGFLLLLNLSSPCVAANSRDVALHGEWKCGPYTMTGDRFETTAIESPIYMPNGTYQESSELTVRLAGGKIVKTKGKSTGRWTLKNDTIEIRYAKIQFLYSSDPAYTIVMGQADADAHQKKRNWAKYKILELNSKLVVLPIETMYKGAEVKVSCVRP